MPNWEIRFMSLDSSFKTVKTSKFPTLKEATDAVITYAASAGFTGIKVVEDGDGYRFTAKTPNGRSGRNVAYGDYDYTDEN